MSLSEWEYLRSLNELSWKFNGFHATNPFASDVEVLSRLNIPAENVSLDGMIARMFLDIMSDNVSNA